MRDNDKFIKVPKSYARVLGRMGLPEFSIIQEDADGIGITAPKAYCNVLLRMGAVGFKEFTDTNYVFRKATECSYEEIASAVLENQALVTVSQSGNDATLTVNALAETLNSIASPYTGETKKYIVMLVRTNFDTVIGAKFGNKTLAQADVDAAVAMGGTAKDIVWWVDAEDIDGQTISKSVSKAGYTTETITVRAKKTSRITYMDGETPITGLTPTFYIEGVGATLPETVTKEHYTFDGWFMSSAGTGDRQYTISATSTGNVTRYAKFTGEQLTITRSITGMTGHGSLYAEYGAPLVETFMPEAEKTLPNDLLVTVGGVTLVKGTDYTYTIGVPVTPGESPVAILEIPGAKVTGNITITGSAT